MFARLAENGDLIGAVVLQAVVTVSLFLVVGRLLRGRSARTLDACAGLAFVLLLAYIGLVWDRVWLVRWLPLSNFIVLGNAFPALTALLAAAVSHRSSLALWRRRIALGGLSVAACAACLAPVVGAAPQCGDRWDPAGACYQTTQFTCSAACAASLLRAHGIEATEQEMARLCLTRQGTTWAGLYRGLKKKTAGTGWDVEIAECDAAELATLRAESDRPLILRVGIGRAGFDSEYVTDWGWSPGVRHSVLLLGYSRSGAVEIFDPTPAIGRESWTRDELTTLWQGQAVRLVPRRERSNVGATLLSAVFR